MTGFQALCGHILSRELRICRESRMDGGGMGVPYDMANGMLEWENSRPAANFAAIYEKSGIAAILADGYAAASELEYPQEN